MKKGNKCMIGLFLSSSHVLQLDMIVIGLGDFYNIKL